MAKAKIHKHIELCITTCLTTHYGQCPLFLPNNFERPPFY